MLNKDVQNFLAAYLDVPNSRIELFSQRLEGLKTAQFPETGLILDIILQLVNLPPEMQQAILQQKERGVPPRHIEHPSPPLKNWA